MAQNTGTLITAAIRPNDSLDPIASAFQNEIMGGAHSYATIAERDSIIPARRQWGMMVTVYNDTNPANNGIYFLTYNKVDTNINNNANWDLFSTSGAVTPTVVVSATGTNNYVGVANPGITAYSQNTIYITQFSNANTGSTATLNIDSVGTMGIFKSGESGPEALTSGDIVPFVNYYLTYDGVGNFQLFNSNPSSADLTYTNPLATQVAVGGVQAGTVFSNTPIKNIFDMLFYPYQSPNFSSFSISGQPTIIEVGATFTAGTKTFLWSTSWPGNVIANSIRITNLTADAGAGLSANQILVNNTANDGTEPFTFSSPIIKTSALTHSWQIRGQRTNGSYFYSNFSVNWRWRLYFGTNVGATLSESQAKSLESSFLGTSMITTYQFGTGGYKYFVVPGSFSNPSLFRDFNTNLAVVMAGASEGYTDTNGGAYNFKYLNITNQFGVLSTYRVYRTKHVLGGSIKITVT
jgi:hypothetical protein